jgi:hypothetical protein
MEEEVVVEAEETVGGDGLDVERFRWRSQSPPTPSVTPTKSVPRHRRGERFLKGPVPWLWLEIAARQPGQALHVAIFLWHRVGMERSPCVPFNLSRLAALGVSRHAASRGLKALQVARLVAVERRRGRPAMVTVLDVSAEKVEAVGPGNTTCSGLHA